MLLSAMSKFCLVVDASCDIPASFNTIDCLRILPVRVDANGLSLIDTRDPEQAQQFYAKFLYDSNATTGKSEPLSEDEMIESLNRVVSINFDEALGVFVSSQRSPIYQRAKRAAARARFETLGPRLAAGKSGPISADCVDSMVLLSGYGAQVLDLLDLATNGANLQEVLARQMQIVKDTYTYMVPGDVDFMLKRAALKGEKSVSALAGFAAKTLSIRPIVRGFRNQTETVGRKLGLAKARDAMLEMVVRLITEGAMRSRHVALSFSGPLEQIAGMDSYKALVLCATKANMKVHLAHMSITAAINIGPQSLTVGFVAKEHSFE
jgi:fatty acid-binding protein DegV